MEVARHWRLNNQRYRLQGSICTRCGKTFFGPRPVCDACSQTPTATYEIAAQAPRRESVEAAYAAGK